MIIDYRKLLNSQEHYLDLGFKIIDVPWIIEDDVDEITRPVEIEGIETNYGGNLVASGEQSFLQLSKDGDLPKGKFQTITPCFRREERDDILHQKWFMKNELIITDNSMSLEEVIEGCLKFFNCYLPCEIVQTYIGYDIEASGYELGSYGFREYEGFKWIYATGCAEPRLSTVINLLK